MAELLKRLASLGGAAFAGACCLGVTAALSMLSAIGAGFLVNDVFLIPLYVALLALSLSLLYRSASARHHLAPFWIGAAGAAAALAGLWVSPIAVYAGLLALIAGNAADLLRARRHAAG